MAVKYLVLFYFGIANSLPAPKFVKRNHITKLQQYILFSPQNSVSSVGRGQQRHDVIDIEFGHQTHPRPWSSTYNSPKHGCKTWKEETYKHAYATASLLLATDNPPQATISTPGKLQEKPYQRLIQRHSDPATGDVGIGWKMTYQPCVL